jgi:hypothetical protein
MSCGRTGFCRRLQTCCSWVLVDSGFSPLTSGITVAVIIIFTYSARILAWTTLNLRSMICLQYHLEIYKPVCFYHTWLYFYARFLRPYVSLSLHPFARPLKPLTFDAFDGIVSTPRLFLLYVGRSSSGSCFLRMILSSWRSVRPPFSIS